MNVNFLLKQLQEGDRKALARCISLVENDTVDSAVLLQNLKIDSTVPIIGITGPPGAGKSTLLNSIISEILAPGVHVAVLAVDPTSIFTKGSVLGDRLRMSEHFNNPNVYIRSVATRGMLGGLSAKTIEIADVLRAAGFNYIFIETVGVGQSEIEIASLADATIVVLVPESGDEIQTIKSGIMEIADIFVINKADREGADRLENSLKTMIHEKVSNVNSIPVLQTVAFTNVGIKPLIDSVYHHLKHFKNGPLNQDLLFNKAIMLAENYLVRKVDRAAFRKSLLESAKNQNFNIHRFVADWFS